MGTLALERLARENPRLTIIHWFPGPVTTPGLLRAPSVGIRYASLKRNGTAGGRCASRLSRNQRSLCFHEGGVPLPDGLGVAKRSGGGIFLVDPQGESTDSELTLAGLRERAVDELVWNFTQDMFTALSAREKTVEDNL